MAYKEVSRMDTAEVIRRWQKGISLRHIASGTGLSRDTVRKYVGAAKDEGVSQGGPAPTGEQLSRLAAVGRTGPARSGHSGRGSAGTVERPGIPVAQRRPPANDLHIGIAAGAGLRCFLHVAAPLHPAPQLGAEAQSRDRPHGAHCSRRARQLGLPACCLTTECYRNSCTWVATSQR